MAIRKEKISDKCEGCKKVDGEYCSVYLFPQAKWRIGNCPMAVHLKREEDEKEKQRVGQQKHKKARNR